MQKKALGEGSFGSAFKATCKSPWRNFVWDWLRIKGKNLQKVVCFSLYNS